MFKPIKILSVTAFFGLSACLQNGLGLQSNVECGLVGAAAGAIIAQGSGGNAATGAVVGGAAGVLANETTGVCN